MKNLTRFFLSSAALAGALHAQIIQLPDNHHLGESATQNQTTGTPSFWGGASTTGRRFQILYDASHFTGIGGVTAPISIQHLRFRGEDTEHNNGGQTYTGVTASVYRTTLNSTAALSTTFATNLAPPAPATTTLLGTVNIPVITVVGSDGTAPNNDIIDLDFTSVPMLPFDPTGALGNEVNLLLEVSYQAAAAATDPQGTTMILIQDTSGSIALVRGRGLFAATAAAVTGSGSLLPPTMKVEFAGPGGFPNFVPATNERFGAACGGSPSAFYQLFAHNQYFDLKDPGQVDLQTGLRLVPNVYPAPTFYTVSGGAAAVDLANGLLAAPTTQGDDDTMLHNLPAGATFAWPGGSTTIVRPSSNGYVIVDPSSTEGSAVPNNFAADFSPTVAEFLGTPTIHRARFAPFWHDFSPNKNTVAPAGDPLSGLHIVNHVAGNQVLVTWYRVGRFNSVAEVFQEEHTMQCSLNWATGVVEFRYGSMDQIWGDTFSGAVAGIVGFSRGSIGGVTASVDPQSRDLSIERPFSTKVEGPGSNMGNTAVATPAPGGATYMGRAFVGQALRWNANNIPAGSLLGVQLLDLGTSRPGLQLPGITAPGCMLSLTPGALIWETFLLPAASVTGTVPLPVPAGYQPGFQGAEVFAQFVVLDGLFGGPNLITVASNALRHVTGNN